MRNRAECEAAARDFFRLSCVSFPDPITRAEAVRQLGEFLAGVQDGALDRAAAIALECSPTTHAYDAIVALKVQR